MVPVAIGEVTTFSKTVSESDVYLFAGISGDFAPNHVDEEYMAGTSFKRRIAHGALLVAFMSACSTKLSEMARMRGSTAVPLSLGYDRIRFLAPVYLGDTVRLTYTIAALDVERHRSSAAIEVHNQQGTLVAAATHLMKWAAPGPKD